MQTDTTKLNVVFRNFLRCIKFDPHHSPKCHRTELESCTKRYWLWSTSNQLQYFYTVPFETWFEATEQLTLQMSAKHTNQLHEEHHCESVLLILITTWNCSRLIATCWPITWTNKPTYLLKPWSSVHLVKLTGLQLVKKFPAVYGTRRFIKAFTSAATSPYPEPARSSPYAKYQFLKIHLNIIFTYTSGSLQWSLSLRFPHQKAVHASQFPHYRYMPCPFHKE